MYSKVYLTLEKEKKELLTKNKVLEKDIIFLKKTIKQKDEVIEDLDKKDYKSKYEDTLKENDELKKKLKEYEELLNIKVRQLNEDSSTSSKPSSTNGFKDVIQNNRKRTGEKPGRKKNHERSSKQISNNPDNIINVTSVRTCTCGHPTIDIQLVVREVVSLINNLVTTHYKGMKTMCPKCKKVYMPKFPKNVKFDTQYDKSIRALIVYLSTHCNISNTKVADLLKFISNDNLNIAPSSVTANVTSFAKKADYTISRIKNGLLRSDVIYEDETPIKVNGKQNCVIGVFTKDLKLLQAYTNRKFDTFIEMGILNIFKGVVVHDHNKIHDKFSNYLDAECNSHVTRYCEAEYLIHHRDVIKEFKNFICDLNTKVKLLKDEGKTSVSDEEYEVILKEYLDLIFKWDLEVTEEEINSKYHTKEINLKKRLRVYADDHLRFLKNFNIEFTNNMAERGLRCVKTKLKTCGFRNIDNANNYCTAISIISTARAQNVGVRNILEDIIDGKKNIAYLKY